MIFSPLVTAGHGDNGLVSKEVAESLATMIKEKTEEASAHNSDGGFDWKKIFADACESVDEKVKASGLPGGSTGVFALITKYEIIVANVGDSRCILVQDQSATSNDQDNRPSTPQLAEESEPVTLEEPADGIENGNRNGDDGGNGATVTAAGEDTAPNEEEGKSSESAPPPASIAEASAENSEGKAMKTLPIVVALSDDHKPNLEEEKERIEGAGLSVLAETFEEEGKLITIHKVQKSGSDKMAVSRSFGDFEYKRNKELGAREQAVIAMPDTRIHVRNANDMFVVLACDGVWDVMTNDEVGKFVLDQYEKLPNGNARGSGLLSQLADALILECFHRGSTDNMTVIVAALNKTVDKFAGGLIQGKALTFMSPPGKNQLTTP